MNEIWKDIKWYETLYMVSNKWRIKSLPKKWSWWHKWKILSIWKRRFWHWWVVLAKDRIYKNTYVHRLVAQAFLWLNINNTKILVCHKSEELINWFLYNGEDNLFLWTSLDNSKDMINKWRSTAQKNIKKLLKKWIPLERFDRYDNYSDWFYL